ncbi:hypothetical protein [Streptomyces sp. adm13(2018)]|nr:hypothetical protein [Streptomyces sp. adm13(2018)]
MTMRPFNLQAWIEEHRHLLKPPVGNAVRFFGLTPLLKEAVR